MCSVPFPVFGLLCAVRATGRRGQLQSGLSLLHLLLLYPRPPPHRVSYRSLFLPLRTVSGSRSTLLRPQAKAQGGEITEGEDLWMKLNPDSLFGSRGLVYISKKVPIMWTLLKAAAGEQWENTASAQGKCPSAVLHFAWTKAGSHKGTVIAKDPLCWFCLCKALQNPCFPGA